MAQTNKQRAAYQAAIIITEKARAFDIIVKKCVSICRLTTYTTVEEYNSMTFIKSENLTAEEFKLLRRLVK